MEAALTGPPEWLERIVLAAIPPQAREGVAGDLWETYQNPWQYAVEAFDTVPFLVWSQMRRNLNLPALMLQGALIFICLGGPVTLLLMPLLLLRDAYQPVTRPCPRHAIRQAILLSAGAMVLLFAIMSARSTFSVRAGVDSFTWLSLFLAALFLSPFLCLFRAGLIMRGDRAPQLGLRDLSKDALAQAYENFQQRVFCRNLLEGMALVFAAASGFFLDWNTLLVASFILTALCLMLESVPRLSRACDFTALRSRYQRDLARQEQLRRFLRWLWFAPVLLALHARLAGDGLVGSGLTQGRPVSALLDCVAAAILCFLVAALNRENGGQVREQIGALDRMREAGTPDLG
ncbi:MAG TPA: hypothetical protein VFI23_10395 [Rhizomicrobium sp.]|nr:hypothetical protein [Rhizomicrobium sp.]